MQICITVIWCDSITPIDRTERCERARVTIDDYEECIWVSNRPERQKKNIYGQNVWNDCAVRCMR